MENTESTIRKIKSLIYKEQTNTILSHLRTWFHGNESHYFGNTSGDQFQIWRFTRAAQGFHPVITGKIISPEHAEPTIHLSAKLNPLGYLQAILGTIGITILAVIMIPTEANMIISFLVFTGVTLTLVGIVYFVYRYETRHHLEQFQKELNKFRRTEQNKLQKQKGE